MNILVVTTSAWRNDDNAGNTMTNFFGEYDENNYYNLYFRSDVPDNKVIQSAFHISDSEIIRNPFGLKKIGHFVDEEDTSIIKNEKVVNSVYDKCRSKKGKTLFFIRDFFWLFNFNKSLLKEYLKTIEPDIIFFTASNYIYIYRIVHWLIKKYNYKLVSFYGDDNYLNRNSKSFSDKVYSFFLRKKIKKNVILSSLNYCSSPIHAKAYEEAFNKDFRSMIKSRDFSSLTFSSYDCSNDSISFLYVGNIYYGRWKTLVELAKKIKEISDLRKENHFLEVYSGNHLSNDIEQAFMKYGVRFKGEISSELVDVIQEKADILVYVESFEELTAKYSFSTKIVDYLHAHRCILALGNSELASIRFFKENDCAQVVNNIDSIESCIEQLIDDASVRRYYADKAWETGVKHCSKESNSQIMIEEMERL